MDAIRDARLLVMTISDYWLLAMTDYQWGLTVGDDWLLVITDCWWWLAIQIWAWAGDEDVAVVQVWLLVITDN